VWAVMILINEKSKNFLGLTGSLGTELYLLGARKLYMAVVQQRSGPRWAFGLDWPGLRHDG
jgi:hypothetical protein